MTNVFENQKIKLLPPPSFTIKEIKSVIPPHCFERSLLKSLQYLVIDLLAITFLFYVASHISLIPFLFIKIPLWILYWFFQGAIMTGIWVLAHECGHQAFSKWKFLNDFIGLILHSLLLVPYHSWKISHGMHHKATSHMNRDQVFVPKTKSQLAAGAGDIHTLISDAPLVNLYQILLMLLCGWPAYLLINAWGQDYGRRANHFEPSSPIFKTQHFWYIIISDIGIAISLILFSFYCYYYGIINFIFYYFVPYLWVNCFLVIITYLQHTDKIIPHYRGDEWTFIRGALATVDRNYGIFNSIFHHIGDTHVAHHFFSTVPHYHAQEVTKYISKFLGKYYNFDNSFILKALWKNWNECHFVEDKGDIVFYQKMDFDSEKGN